MTGIDRKSKTDRERGAQALATRRHRNNEWDDFMFFFTYLRHELWQRKRQAVVIALGLALGVGLAVVGLAVVGALLAGAAGSSRIARLRPSVALAQVA